VNDYLQANPGQLPITDPEHISDVFNLEHVLISMDSQHFDLLYEDYMFDNRKKYASENKEIIKLRANRSISKLGDENLKNIEDAFESMGQEEALMRLKMLDQNIRKKEDNGKV